MNKLLLDNNKLSLKDETIYLKESGNLEINIAGIVTIYDYNLNSKEVNHYINLENNSKLNYYKFDKINNNFNLVINSYNNTDINYFYSFISNKNSNLNIVYNVLGSNSKSNIKIKTITEKNGSIHIRANAIITEKTKNNNIIEDIKVLKLNNLESVIEPFLCVNTNDLFATHNGTSGGISKDELFYLMSKGISFKKAIELIKKGFLNTDLKTDIESLL